MSRLSKMLIYNGITLNNWDPRGEFRLNAPVVSSLDIVSDLTVMDPELQRGFIANVIAPCHYIDATGICLTTDSDKVDLVTRLKDTLIAPPFKHTWIDLPEMMIPDRDNTRLRKCAVLIDVGDLKEGLQYVYFGFFVEIGAQVRGPLTGMDFMLDRSGHIAGDVTWMHPYTKRCWGGRQQIAITSHLLHSAISVMLFLSCKVSKLYRDTVSDKVQKKAKRRLGKKFRSYTLNIDSPGITYEAVDAFSDKRKLPWHTVRGHIRIYTAEKPHVSGYVGPMCILPHVRGNKDYGEIHKDYKLTPKEPVLV